MGLLVRWRAARSWVAPPAVALPRRSTCRCRAPAATASLIATNNKSKRANDL